MLALHSLIHSLAKEEKRLYHLHRKKARFVSIYEAYAAEAEYSRELDRKIYQQDFASFSKAYYSMQKNELLEDILAVLLEHSNSSRPEFQLVKAQAQYQVLRHKGFNDLALDYLTAARNAATEAGDHQAQVRILEDQRDTLAAIPSTTWSDYTSVLEELSRVRNLVAGVYPLQDEKRKFMVLLQSAAKDPANTEEYQRLAHEVLDLMRTYAAETARPDAMMDIFECECAFIRQFQDAMALHRKMLEMDKVAQRDGYPLEQRLKLTNMVMESSLEVGDFLQVNGLIYRIQRDVEKLTPAQQADFLPRFLELSAIYHFYENDMQASQEEVQRVLALPDIYPADRLRYLRHRLGIQLAGNLPRTAQESLNSLVREFPAEAQSFDIRLMQVVIHIEMNQREEAKALVQKMRNSARKDIRISGETTEAEYLEQLSRFLAKKPVKTSELPAVSNGWKMLFKPDLWLLSKVENKFYYNSILEFWHRRKRVLSHS
jgi:hypothetical protein